MAVPRVPDRLVAPVLLGLYAVVAVLTIACCDGTGDAGDSVSHYLYARYAPRHPALFFDHWAKPLYVLLACPFAQAGFVGAKVFNALLSGLSAGLAYRIARRMGLANAALAVPLLLCAPVFFILTFSGLTEPLFAALLCLALLLTVEGRERWGLVVVSFLPFVRSEGLLVIGVFGLFLLLKRRFTAVPWLLLGTLVYSLAGWPVHGDPLWTFTRIPYASGGSPYGSGGAFHFLEQLFYVLGAPIHALLGVGLVRTIHDVVRRKVPWDRYFLVVGPFIAFVLAHSAFWTLGIFHSMGMNRVLVAVAPLAALIALVGANTLADWAGGTQRFAGRAVLGLLAAAVLVFPFTEGPAAVDRQRDLMRSADQHLADRTAAFIRTHRTSSTKVFCMHPYLCLALDVDRFDPQQWNDLTPTGLQWATPGDLVVWENWFAVVEGGVPEEVLAARLDLQQVYAADTTARGRTIRYAVYRKVLPGS